MTARAQLKEDHNAYQLTFQIAASARYPSCSISRVTLRFHLAEECRSRSNLAIKLGSIVVPSACQAVNRLMSRDVAFCQSMKIDRITSQSLAAMLEHGPYLSSISLRAALETLLGLLISV